jgi:hypothetical protein
MTCIDLRCPFVQSGIMPYNDEMQTPIEIEEVPSFSFQVQPPFLYSKHSRTEDPLL